MCDVRLFGIYAIIDRATTPDPERLLEDILEAGVRLVQLRSKAGVDRDLVRALHRRTRPAGAQLIVNDDLEAAGDADGVHLGQADLATVPGDLRAILGDRILGVSAGNLAELGAALAAGPDYVGTGPFRATGSKADAGGAIGVDGVTAVVRGSPVPVAAIGGIELDDLAAIVRTGARMAAVIAAIARGPDRQANARALVERWQKLHT